VARERRHGGPRVERFPGGARLVEADVVLSEVRAVPGPTHDLFDLLAAAVVTLAPGPRLALLGFAAGGILAPLRGMGWDHPVAAVDLDLSGVRLFRELCSSWAGDVRVDREDALAWLARRRRRFDAILEDLSVPGIDGGTKPPVSLDGLPELIPRRLAPGGIAVVNLLPVTGMGWGEIVDAAGAHYPARLLVEFELWENRVLLGGETLPPARETGRRIRNRLQALGSREAHRLRVRTLPPGPGART